MINENDDQFYGSDTFEDYYGNEKVKFSFDLNQLTIENCSSS